MKLLAVRFESCSSWHTSSRIASQRGLVETGDPVADGRIVGNSANIEPSKDYIHDGDHIGGYSCIRAANIDEAAAMCVDCPILGEGGFVELREIVTIGG